MIPPGGERSRLRFAHALKRTVDICLAAALLVLSVPALALCMAWVRMRSPGPALFRQQREGLGGRPFVMYKLRTMRPNADDILARHLASNEAALEEWQRYRRLAEDPRLIPGAGRPLRQTSLDELPQLWNVLRGDMSLVGPRPLELSVAVGLPPVQRQLRTSVRPGLTGYWQISGRSELDLSTLAAMDTEYVREWSFWRDLVILSRTPAALISRRGAF